MIERSPAILYGLGNLVENAVDFAAARVEIAVRWSEQDVAITISDDGPGFPSEILARIGEPYVTSRRRTGAESEESGLGLGLLHRQDAAGAHRRDARVPQPAGSRQGRRGARALGPRQDFEAPMTEEPRGTAP